MVAVSQIEICNRALAHLPAGQIADMNENSLEARECRRFYEPTVRRALEREDWSFINTRAILALKGTNDREQEWLYAYALPSNMGGALRVVPDFEGAGIGYPIPLPGQPYAESWLANGQAWETPYIIEGDTLYSNILNARLEYSINDVAGVGVTELFLDALALQLAQRHAMPVKKDSQREQALAAAARTAWDEAVADDRNRHPVNSGQYVSEAMAARRGYITEAP
jgi:hypothetical protein